MEAVPRLPMISFDIKVNTEVVSFASKLKQYISDFYHEDPESYNNEMHSLETLRAAAVRPSIDVAGCQLLKKYFCQLHFLKSRFPMEENQACAVYFSWRDTYSNMVCSVPDIDFELMNVLYDIGAVHSKLGAADNRVTPEGMKMACTHFQCAAWAFQSVRENYPQMVSLVLAPEVIHFMHLTCLAQAQECILEKSMMDNRKATIIAKVAVQVVDYYRQALTTLQTTGDEGSLSDLVGSRTYKDWMKYLNFKVAYHKAIALLYQGQQAEEQQKMGERVAFYQAASDQLQEACKRANNLSHQQEIGEALAFTGDVVEGKKKAAKNENEFIYHEDVPDKDALQEVKGASLVKGIAFNVNDVEVSGADIFARLVPMEAHEASSLYSEQKAQMLRQLGELVENKDRALAEFMSSMQLDVLTQMRQATGITQDLVDRAAAMSARPTATQDLINAMGKLSNTYHDVEAMLNEIDSLLKEEEKKEQEYQVQMGTRPPGIIATDLTREFTKYQEAHSKASDSNQNLHRAMTTHVANLKVLALPLSQLKQQIPSIELPNSEVDEEVIKEMEALVVKVDEMKNQRALLWAQLRDAIQNDDITGLLVTRSPEKSLEQLFQQELNKHKKQAALIEQNMAAQENILKALIDTYAKFTNTRRYLQDVISKRSTTLSALINSYDTYDDLLAKANKGLEFYSKLETNVTKLLQRIKSTCKVQDEEREQMLAKHNKKKVAAAVAGAPKLKDFLEPKLKDYIEPRKTEQISGVLPEVVPSAGITGMVPNMPDHQVWPPAVRPAPVGSEMNNDSIPSYNSEQSHLASYSFPMNSGQVFYNASYATAVETLPNTTPTYSNNYNYMYSYSDKSSEQDLSARMAALMSKPAPTVQQQQQPQQVVSSQAYIYPSSSTPNYNTYYQQPESLPKSEISGNTYAPMYNYSETPAPLGQPTSAAYSATAYPYQSNSYAYNSPLPQTATNFVYTTAGSQNFGQATFYSSAEVPYQTHTQTDVQSQNYMQPLVYTSGLQPDSIAYPSSAQVPITYASTNIDGSIATSSSNQPYSYPVPDASNYNQQFQLSDRSTNQGVVGGSIVKSDQMIVSQDSYSFGYVGGSGGSSYDALYGGSIPGGSNFYNKQVYGQTYNTEAVSSNAYNAYSNQGLDNLVNYGVYPNAVGVCTTVSNNLATDAYISYTTDSSASQPVFVKASAVSTEQVKKEKSNVDLLSGLDFSINQVPLMPQQNKTEVPVKEISSTTTIKPVEAPIAPLIKPATVKTEDKLSTHKNIVHVEKKYSDKQFQKDVFQNPDVLKQLMQEVEKFEKFVDLLSTKTLNGPTPLDLKWKEIIDSQELEQHKKSISVARCYPMKNRFPDILPYDQTRVKLYSTKDDYINASVVKDITPNSPVYIITQAPVQSTYLEFWTMVWEQQIEIIVCLLSDSELDQDIYWPRGQDMPLSLANMMVSLQHTDAKMHWTERMLCINHLEQRTSRTVRHLQFTTWPSSLFPPPAAVVNYIHDILRDPRSLAHPLLVHCLAGIGRSGLLCLLISVIVEVFINPALLPDLPAVVIKLSSARKNVLRDREHFRFGYHAFLYFLKEISAKGKHEKKPMESSTSIESSSTLSDSTHDPLNMLDPLWATRKGT